MIYILGIITGILLSLVAILVGKKYEGIVNDPTYTIAPFSNTTKAEIIKKEDPIEEFLK